MTPDRFDHLLSLVQDKISKKTHIRQPISAAERLAITLRYLATGDSQQSIAFLFKVGHSTVNSIINEVCTVIKDSLHEYITPPYSHNDWKRISVDFEDFWNMPHCLGAIDGKHIAMKKPAHTGTLYHNYKGFFSMVLLAICDARYNFTVVDVGEYGSNNDCGVLLNSKMGKKFDKDRFNVPDPERIPDFNDTLPYFLVGDEIFPLKQWLMRPFAGKQLTDENRKIFNYRLSRARRIIENTFGILVARWRIFQKAIEGKPETVEKIVLAATALHNYLQQTDNAHYTPAGFIDSENSSGAVSLGQWRKFVNTNFQAIRPVRNSRYLNTALQVRDSLAEYFVSENGSVPWQWEYIRRTGEN